VKPGLVLLALLVVALIAHWLVVRHERRKAARARIETLRPHFESGRLVIPAARSTLEEFERYNGP